MCGIAGFCDFNKRSTSDTLEKMTMTLNHRGPDDRGYEVIQNNNATLGFGHTRLSILDLSPLGHQPMKLDDLIITYNGEVYNFQEIRVTLEDKGIKFKSHSDTEVILRAFQVWGIECIQKFRGMFAFALYDLKEETLWLVRDRVGVKPLYYHYNEGTLLFGSELKAFHQHPDFVKEIDHNAVALFLQYSYIPAPHCIFMHTKKVLPGHFVKISLADRSVKTEQYWSVLDAYNQPQVNDIDEQEAINETEKILTESFNYRMVADVPVGLFLSGGIDSSAVAAILQKDRTERLKTFTIGFDVNGFDESPYADKISEILGTDHTQYYCTPTDALDIIPKIPEIYDEPFSDNSVVPTILVSQLARKSVTVALSGDGGDEIFGGYDKFNRSLLLSKGWGMPKRMVSSLMDKIDPNKIPILKDQYNFSTRYAKFNSILGAKSETEIMKVISQHIPKTEAHSLMKASVTEYKTYFDTEFNGIGNDPLSKLLAVDYLTFLNDNNLTKMDKATMSVGLEGREPFLDHHVIDWVAKLPSSLKIKGGTNKHLLKEIVYKYLPKELMDRQKTPFLAPLSVWFMDRLKDFFVQYLDEDKLRKEGIFHPEPILEMRDNFLNGKRIKHQKLWNILIFEMWYERWMK